MRSATRYLYLTPDGTEYKEVYSPDNPPPSTKFLHYISLLSYVQIFKETWIIEAHFILPSIQGETFTALSDIVAALRLIGTTIAFGYAQNTYNLNVAKQHIYSVAVNSEGYLVYDLGGVMNDIETITINPNDVTTIIVNITDHVV